MTENLDAQIFELQSGICQTLANPKRLHILHLLKDGEMAVADMIMNGNARALFNLKEKTRLLEAVKWV